MAVFVVRYEFVWKEDESWNLLHWSIKWFVKMIMHQDGLDIQIATSCEARACITLVIECACWLRRCLDVLHLGRVFLCYSRLHCENVLFIAHQVQLANYVLMEVCGLTYQEPLLLAWIISIPVRVGNYIHYKVWYEITYPFPNFSVGAVEVWEWIDYFIPHFTGHVITYPCVDSS